MTTSIARTAIGPSIAPTLVRSTRLRRPVPHRGSPVDVVHLSAECAPFARTGGLGEAVRTLAMAQAAAGMTTRVIMPLYQMVRDGVPDLFPVSAPFTVRVGSRSEVVRLFSVPARADEPTTFFVDHRSFSRRTGLYGDGDGDYPDNAFRFAVLCLAAVAALPDIAPEAAVLHAHDWHAALAPVYLRTVFRDDPRARRVATVLSVHNAGFQGHHAPEMMPELGLDWALYEWRRFEWYGRMNVLKGGLAFADVATTVSPTHAAELRTAIGGFGLHEAFGALGDRFIGVLNGIDQRLWDPATDSHLPAHYSRDATGGKQVCKTALQRAFGLAERPRVPLFAFCARLVAQKGLDILLESGVLDRADAQFVFLGEGDARYADALAQRATASPETIGVQLAFTDPPEHRLLAGADGCLVPSLYEPCGLTQMRAQRYGTLPVAHRVGGLADTITDGLTGFLFASHTPTALAGAVARAVAVYAEPERWATLVRAAMRRDFGAERSVAQFGEVYRRARAAHR